MLRETKIQIILRIELVTYMLQYLKLSLYNEINLSVGFQDSFSHVWEHSRFTIQTGLNKPDYIKKPSFITKTNVFSPLLVKSMEEMY